MQITLPKWLGLLVMLILCPGVCTFCAVFLMIYTDDKWSYFVAGAIALNAFLQARGIYRILRDAG